MTSKQVQLTLVSLVLVLSGCSLFGPQRSPVLVSPYAEPRIVAVVPFLNESGTGVANGERVADALTKHLDGAEGLVALPVNRVLAGLVALETSRITSAGEARALMRWLGADQVIVGTITSYDPYDPPTIGLALESYEEPVVTVGPVDLRDLTRAGTGTAAGSVSTGPAADDGATVSLSAVLDASDPRVRDALKAYAVDRGPADADPDAWLHHQRNMNLYIEFACHEMARRLLAAEAQRLGVTDAAAGSGRQAWPALGAGRP
ncbi:hypothetical protein [Mucisphaera sp.]|uniref:hypothetical protein n=1 Tax=Mucisphaera sp. TaxID=2913024 RepID=UPI003D120B8D